MYMQISSTFVFTSGHSVVVVFFQCSKEVTGVFFQLGQKPFLKLKVGYRSIDWDEIQIYSQSFNTMQR